MTAGAASDILREILLMDRNNLFLQYIVARLRGADYRGWHVSQHNRYTMRDIIIILQNIRGVAGMGRFAIPPGDYRSDAVLSAGYRPYQTMVSQINAEMGRGTLNSLKKNFFPDLERMGFLLRENQITGGSRKPVLHGQLTDNAAALIDAGEMINQYKIFTDGVDNLFGSKISELAGMLSVSDYADDTISIHEFMFILSDNDGNLDKIKLLTSYRSLKKHQRDKVIALAAKYARPENFQGNKTALRDFHNWKNQAQQILSLLKTTVYFEVEHNHSFRLNVGSTGFFQPPSKRSAAPKRKYFAFHGVGKRDEFELHHIVPISSARNKKEAGMVDDHRNLIYIHRAKHKTITRNGNRHVVLTIAPKTAVFSDFENTDSVETANNHDALYATNQRKINTVARYNAALLKSIFDFEQS